MVPNIILERLGCCWQMLATPSPSKKKFWVPQMKLYNIYKVRRYVINTIDPPLYTSVLLCWLSGRDSFLQQIVCEFDS